MQIECTYSSTAKTYVNKNKQEQLGIINLNTVNQLTEKIETAQPAPLS